MKRREWGDNAGGRRPAIERAARLALAGDTGQIIKSCVPPRMWKLNQTSSWLNFHLGRDHQSASNEIALRCGTGGCRDLA